MKGYRITWSVILQVGLRRFKFAWAVGDLGREWRGAGRLRWSKTKDFA